MTTPSTTPPASPSTPETVPPDQSLRVTLPHQASPQERWLWRGLIVVLCLLIYAPSFSHSFLWGDDFNAKAPAYLRDLDGLSSIWTKLGHEAGGTTEYRPVAHTLYWLEYQGLAKAGNLGYRVVSVLLHAGAALLLWELLRKLLVPGAFIAALLFAVHPLFTESVAWTTQQRDPLALLLAFTSLYLYARFANLFSDAPVPATDKPAEPDWNLYGLSVLAFAAATLSNAATGVLPIWLALLLYWKGKLTTKHLTYIAPLLLISLLSGLLVNYTQYLAAAPIGALPDPSFINFATAKLTGSLPPIPSLDLPISQRLLLTGVAPFVYASKILAPISLIFVYPHWDLSAAPAYWWAGIFLLVAAIAGAAYAATRGHRWPLVLLLAYLVALLPATGLFDTHAFSDSYIADHFAYPAAWVLLVGLSAALATLASRFALDRDPRVALGLSSLLVLALAARTYVHSTHFLDNYTLFTHTYANNPTSWTAAHQLGNEYVLLADIARTAERKYRRDRDIPNANLARQEGDDLLNKARELITRSLELNPNQELAYFDLGRVSFVQNIEKEDFGEALDFLRKSDEARKKLRGEASKPYPVVYALMGDMLGRQGNFQASRAYYRDALAVENPPITPNSGLIRLGLLKVELKALHELTAKNARAATRPTTLASTLPTTVPNTLAAIPAPTTNPTTNPSALPTTGPSAIPPQLAGATLRELTDIALLARDTTMLLPQSIEAWTVAGDVMRELVMPRAALYAYRQALQLNPKNDNSLVSFGIAAADLGDLEGAKVAFQEALRIRPARNDAQRFLAMVEEMMRNRPPTTRTTATTQTSQPAEPTATPTAP